MKLSSIARILDDCTEVNVYDGDNPFEPVIKKATGEELLGMHYDGIRIKNAVVVGMYVTEDCDLVVIVDLSYYRDKQKRKESEVAK